MASSAHYNTSTTQSWTEILPGGLQPQTAALTTFMTLFLGFVAYFSQTPEIDRRAPVFTKDTLPFIGSWSFFTQKM